MQTNIENTGEGKPRENRNGTPTFVPRVDIYEEPESVVILADLPGVGERDVDLRIEKNVLTISATVASQVETNNLRLREYREGNYKRAIQLSDMVDPEKVDASIKNGVLKIVLSKSARNQSRRIQVRTN